MNMDDQPQAGSYEAALTEEQRVAFRALLLSDVTLAEAQAKAELWPAGENAGKRPTIGCLGKIRTRLRIEERIARLETAAATRRATRNLLKKMVEKTDQEQLLDEAITLIGEQMIDASFGMDSASHRLAAGWLMLRRADQRRYDRRTGIFEG